VATTKFNKLIREVARRLQEPQSAHADYLAGTAYDRYSVALVAGYLNDAIREEIEALFMQYGERFPDLVPEMTKFSGALPLNAGSLLKPSDFLFPLGMVKSDNTIIFRKIKGINISAALAGIDPDLQGSATEPVFYDEGTYLRTLGVTGGNVVLRYVIKHLDIVVSEAAAGNGKWLTANGAYTSATKRLTGAFNVAKSTADAGKDVMFRTTVKVYHNRILSTDPDAFSYYVLDGTDLPVADIASGDIIQCLVSDLAPQSTDLQLSENHFGRIIERAVQKGIVDARRGLIQEAK